MIHLLLVALLQAGRVAIPSDLAEELKSIKLEQAAVELADAQLGKEKAAINKKQGLNTDVEELLAPGIKKFEAGHEQFLRHVHGLNEEGGRQQALAAEVNAAVANYNSRCAGTFESESYVAACNAEKAGLERRQQEVQAWFEKLKARQMALESTGDALEKQSLTLSEISEGLRKDQQALGTRIQKYNDDIGKLDLRKHALMERNNKALARLAKSNAVSKECAEIARQITPEVCAGKGDPSDPANWNTPCEVAARCLQRVWDGAR